MQIPSIYSLADFQQNASAHLQSLRETGQPEILTVNGKAELVIQAAEAYEALLSKIEMYETSLAVNRGLRDYAEGRCCSLEEFSQQMQVKLDELSSKH